MLGEQIEMNQTWGLPIEASELTALTFRNLWTGMAQEPKDVDSFFLIMTSSKLIMFETWNLELSVTPLQWNQF